ncbi:hypothetical protein TGME49_295740 [Toxoplasma gondii ME49]|uniref:Uncharacterized protein n=4 Tax=Toxoplasma gondii TaxID=5811 RepID=A0A125YJU0_TOXGV|nr:hypothetical protein TGME49_295740 [Toxoplasma gondii ME49]EPR57745.1 hypothetical protein TGGT1_295740 [Toxoplasma gondii GT1]EPT32502.1 hypothetical protein TGME49_295740 [Toxoplasma gondii ME49]ESS29159.1 hypothetical protein TGVEG_295740 [Toxoplasma gondii VEG]KAF4646252.1 hypothetical protein TGRH88_020390 [Toxoplasma gondii]|eukprot:XP_002371513.2 hypothetical protein TGME49_295740 [Toxoplasma gondii ME49]
MERLRACRDPFRQRRQVKEDSKRETKETRERQEGVSIPGGRGRGQQKTSKNGGEAARKGTETTEGEGLGGDREDNCGEGQLKAKEINEGDREKAERTEIGDCGEAGGAGPMSDVPAEKRRGRDEKEEKQIRKLPLETRRDPEERTMEAQRALQSDNQKRELREEKRRSSEKPSREALKGEEGETGREGEQDDTPKEQKKGNEELVAGVRGKGVEDNPAEEGEASRKVTEKQRSINLGREKEGQTLLAQKQKKRRSHQATHSKSLDSEAAHEERRDTSGCEATAAKKTISREHPRFLARKDVTDKAGKKPPGGDRRVQRQAASAERDDSRVVKKTKEKAKTRECLVACGKASPSSLREGENLKRCDTQGGSRHYSGFSIKIGRNVRPLPGSSSSSLASSSSSLTLASSSPPARAASRVRRSLLKEGAGDACSGFAFLCRDANNKGRRTQVSAENGDKEKKRDLNEKREIKEKGEMKEQLLHERLRRQQAEHRCEELAGRLREMERDLLHYAFLLKRESIRQRRLEEDNEGLLHALQEARLLLKAESDKVMVHTVQRRDSSRDGLVHLTESEALLSSLTQMALATQREPRPPPPTRSEGPPRSLKPAQSSEEQEREKLATLQEKLERALGRLSAEASRRRMAEALLRKTRQELEEQQRAKITKTDEAPGGLLESFSTFLLLVDEGNSTQSAVSPRSSPASSSPSPQHFHCASAGFSAAHVAGDSPFALRLYEASASPVVEEREDASQKSIEEANRDSEVEKVAADVEVDEAGEAEKEEDTEEEEGDGVEEEEYGRKESEEDQETPQSFASLSSCASSSLPASLPSSPSSSPCSAPSSSFSGSSSRLLTRSSLASSVSTPRAFSRTLSASSVSSVSSWEGRSRLAVHETVRHRSRETEPPSLPRGLGVSVEDSEKQSRRESARDFSELRYFRTAPSIRRGREQKVEQPREEEEERHAETGGKSRAEAGEAGETETPIQRRGVGESPHAARKERGERGNRKLEIDGWNRAEEAKETQDARDVQGAAAGKEEDAAETVWREMRGTHAGDIFAGTKNNEEKGRHSAHSEEQEHHEMGVEDKRREDDAKEKEKKRKERETGGDSEGEREQVAQEEEEKGEESGCTTPRESGEERESDETKEQTRRRRETKVEARKGRSDQGTVRAAPGQVTWWERKAIVAAREFFLSPFRGHASDPPTGDRRVDSQREGTAQSSSRRGDEAAGAPYADGEDADQQGDSQVKSRDCGGSQRGRRKHLRTVRSASGSRMRVKTRKVERQTNEPPHNHDRCAMRHANPREFTDSLLGVPTVEVVGASEKSAASPRDTISRSGETLRCSSGGVGGTRRAQLITSSRSPPSSCLRTCRSPSSSSARPRPSFSSRSACAPLRQALALGCRSGQSSRQAGLSFPSSSWRDSGSDGDRREVRGVRIRDTKETDGERAEDESKGETERRRPTRREREEDESKGETERRRPTRRDRAEDESKGETERRRPTRREREEDESKGETERRRPTRRERAEDESKGETERRRPTRREREEDESKGETERRRPTRREREEGAEKRETDSRHPGDTSLERVGDSKEVRQSSKDEPASGFREKYGDFQLRREIREEALEGGVCSGENKQGRTARRQEDTERDSHPGRGGGEIPQRQNDGVNLETKRQGPGDRHTLEREEARHRQASSVVVRESLEENTQERASEEKSNKDVSGLSKLLCYQNLRERDHRPSSSLCSTPSRQSCRLQAKAASSFSTQLPASLEMSSAYGCGRLSSHPSARPLSSPPSRKQSPLSPSSPSAPLPPEHVSGNLRPFSKELHPGSACSTPWTPTQSK